MGVRKSAAPRRSLAPRARTPMTVRISSRRRWALSGRSARILAKAAWTEGARTLPLVGARRSRLIRSATTPRGAAPPGAHGAAELARRLVHGEPVGVVQEPDQPPLPRELVTARHRPSRGVHKR